MPSFSCAGPMRISASVARFDALHPRAARQRRVEGRHAPVVAAAGRLVGGGERRTDHHRVGAARDRLGDVAAGAHPAVGDDVHVDAGLVEVTDAGAGGVGDGGGLRHADAEHAAAGARVTGADTHEHADRTGAHEVQRGGVRRAPADDDRHVELADELLEVERLDRLRHVLGRHDRALDHEDVELGFEHVLGVLLDALGRERRARDDAGVLDLTDAATDQLFLDRLGVDLLHPPGGLLVRELGDLLEQHVGVVVARPQALEVEAARCRRADPSRSRCGATARRPSPNR